METPTIEEVKAYFQNAKEVRCLFDKKIYDISKAIIREDNKNQFEAWFPEDYDYCRLHKKGIYATIISYKETEPTTEVRNSVLLQPFSEKLIRKEFPKLFENKLEVGKWYKSRANRLVYRTGTHNNYGFCRGMIWKNDLMCYEPKNWELATPQEVETALIQEAKKRGFEEGLEVDCFGINNELIRGGNFELLTNENNLAKVAECVLWFGKGKNGTDVFRDGQWATIIETPTDIITIVEKYGKDKVISLIEKM